MPTQQYGYGYPATPAQKKPTSWYGAGMTETVAPPAQPNVFNQQPPPEPTPTQPTKPEDVGPSPWGWDPFQLPADNPTGGGNIPPGGPGGSSGNPGGTTNPGGGAGGDGPLSWGSPSSTPGTLGYQEPTGGLYDYYKKKMGSTGMGSEEYSALYGSTMTPLAQQTAQAREAMLRTRAATGNDAGIYAGLSQISKDAGATMSDQARKNFLADQQIKREEQQQGAAGALNLYGQEQQQTMEYLRMLGNLLGRVRATDQQSSSSGSSSGISYNPSSL